MKHKIVEITESASKKVDEALAKQPHGTLKRDFVSKIIEKGLKTIGKD